MPIERIVPGTIEWEAFYANHIGRYNFAINQRNFEEKLNILDAACGVGYGSNYLSRKLNCSVTAIDRSTEALKIANALFNASNINFLEDDCHTLASAASNGPYDVIVSFETLEHLPHPEKFLESCFQNLKVNGDLIISTPNQLISSPNGNLTWEYHEKEYTPAEFMEILLSTGFSNIKLYGQKLTETGKLRDQFRAELNRIYSNPFIRLGRLVQKILRKRPYLAVLPEQLEDFEIESYATPDEIANAGSNAPFVLIAVCTKS